jgi:hypothetical protein
MVTNAKECPITIDEAWNTLVSELCVRAQYSCYETRVFLYPMYTVNRKVKYEIRHNNNLVLHITYSVSVTTKEIFIFTMSL